MRRLFRLLTTVAFIYLAYLYFESSPDSSKENNPILLIGLVIVGFWMWFKSSELFTYEKNVKPQGVANPFKPIIKLVISLVVGAAILTIAIPTILYLTQ